MVFWETKKEPPIDWEDRYRCMSKGFNDLNIRLKEANERLETLQHGVGRFIGIAVAIDVLRTTPQLEDAFLLLCDEFKRSHDE